MAGMVVGGATLETKAGVLGHTSKAGEGLSFMTKNRMNSELAKFGHAAVSSPYATLRAYPTIRGITLAQRNDVRSSCEVQWRSC